MTNSLELVVKIIDVRYNRKKAEIILERSEKLRGYSLLLNYVNLYRNEGYLLDAAIDIAVKRCIDEDILRDFLVQYGKEVRCMLYDDITIEKFAKIRGEESWEEGRQQGLIDGRQQGEATMQERINQLNEILLEEGKFEELRKSTKDKIFQQKLFEEYGI